MNRKKIVAAVFASALVAVVALGVSLAGQTAPQVAPADLVLRGGRIITLDDGTPAAQALAARNGAIVFVGSNTDVAKFVGPATRVINLLGQTAIPGFIEGHGHFTGVGENKINLDLMGTK